MYDSKEVVVTTYEPSELRFCLSGNDALTLLEFIQKSLNCNTKEDFRSLYPKLRELLPFDFANSLLGHHDTEKGLVLVYGVNISYPEEWIQEYVANDYLPSDVTIREQFNTYKLNFWDIARLRLCNQHEGIISLYLDYGMTGRYTHGACLAATGKNGSAFCFTGPTVEMNRRTEAILEFVIPHLHLALSQLYSNRQLQWSRPAITQRETEILKWLKEGKNSWDISVILGISERTVNFHVNNLKRKLGATNRPQAVAVAARLGLVEFD